MKWWKCEDCSKEGPCFHCEIKTSGLVPLSCPYVGDEELLPCNWRPCKPAPHVRDDEVKRLQDRISQLETQLVDKTKEEAKDKFPPHFYYSPSKCKRCGGEMKEKPKLRRGTIYYCAENCGYGWNTSHGEISIPENGCG